MSKRNDKLLILDILDCIAKIQRYTKGYTLREFTRDTKTIDAVVRNIEIIEKHQSIFPEKLKAVLIYHGNK